MMKLTTAFLSPTILAILGMDHHSMHVNARLASPPKNNASRQMAMRSMDSENENWCADSPFTLLIELEGSEDEEVDCESAVKAGDCNQGDEFRRQHFRSHCSLKCASLQGREQHCQCRDSIGSFWYENDEFSEWTTCQSMMIKDMCGEADIQKTCPETCGICPDSA